MEKKPEKRGRGRPPKPDAERRRDLPRLAIPLTAEERELVAAAAGDKPLTAWARELLLRAARRKG